jgi:hypothetical protein
MSILYLSDFHYNRFGRGLAENIGKEIEKINPDVILLGGDYADSKKGVCYFSRMMASIAHCKNIFGIAGNHDRWRKNRIREIIESCNGIWLEDRSAVIRVGGLTIQIDGGRPAAQSCRSDLSILCLHQPREIAKIAHRYNLIFAGHLHAGQIVLWQTEKGLYPGRLIYKWNRLSADFGDCQYLISKGLGDSLPIRYNCKRDAILVGLGSD